MADQYVTLEEAADLLSKSEAEIKALVAEGKLRELRDAGKVFFRKEDLDNLGAKEGSSIVELAATEEPESPGTGDAGTFADALSSLKDESSSLGVLEDSGGEAPSRFKLVDDEEGSPPIELTADSFPEHLPAADAPKTEGAAEEEAQPVELTSEIDLLPSDSAVGLSPLGGISPDIGLSPEEGAKADAPQTADADIEVPDLGLSGSSIIALEPTLDDVAPSPAKMPPAEAKKGISVFDDDEIQIDADPMGETRIASGIDELEAVGSGSGLLDITQESDDTSLGAALLDVISPTGEAAETAAEGEEPVLVASEAEETAEDSGAIMTADDEAAPAPAYAEAAVAGPAVAIPAPRAVPAGAMAGAAPVNASVLVAVAAMAVTGLAAAGQIQGVWPSFLDVIAKDMFHYITFGALGAAALGLGIWGILAGRK